MALQVDDSLGFGSLHYHRKEENASINFKSIRSKLIQEGTVDLNGLTITRNGEIMRMTQKDNLEKMTDATD